MGTAKISGALRARIVGEAEPTLVLLHGFGAPGDDLVPLARFVDAGTPVRFVFPEAPLALSSLIGDARAWWMIDFEAREAQLAAGALDLSEEEPEGLTAARETVVELLSELDVQGPLVLGGFSQGAMLAMDVALRSDIELAGLVQLSSTLLARDLWVPRMSGLSVPIFQSHGASDPLLPMTQARALRAELENAGAQVSWEEFDGGHEIPLPVLKALGRWLGEILA